MIAETVARHRRRTDVPAIAAALLPAVGPPEIVACGERIRGGAPVTTADRWHIGSCMKAMTAATVALFVQSGRLRWETPLAEVFDGVHPGWGSVPVAALLTGTSGLPAHPGPDELRSALTDPAPLPRQRSLLVERYLCRPPRHPGRFVYSNLGYVVVGAALERLTGAPFEEVLTRELLRPLRIGNAGFGPPTGAQPWGHRARRTFLGIGMGRGPAIDPADPSPEHPPDNPPLLSPAGRLHVDLAGWAEFVRLFLNGPERLLTADSLRRLTTPPGTHTRQAMGWAIPKGPFAFAQQGSNARWVATAVVDPGRSTAALVVCNDGRTRMLRASLDLALALLRRRDDPRP
ncbi:hypothetical protein Val02_62320 [Virgisporangium aliadipatigenens]|uniref:Beta-lactamase-related domain-containing protein n=1 Tax=Virgisporangium aliadipatigenens TaxID=741659 RepID=A0A8J4DTJ0_9ACTN|nr:serine hydrolase domain-containing protein [Virgisporangium aliadipatigenens]GIJ49346.1 hypothetical protein Val02_62320 [Virgisporangium aliadipatigenens]